MYKYLPQCAGASCINTINFSNVHLPWFMESLLIDLCDFIHSACAQTTVRGIALISFQIWNQILCVQHGIGIAVIVLQSRTLRNNKYSLAPYAYSLSQ